MNAPLVDPHPDACVTASDLVRRFGTWQERALARPVFVMRRGRPGWCSPRST
ncbi:hypothetical protein [Sphingomonas baiyangensis]|uniref:hypothetical protein n=1 Tax=Sphingomonas baiyangensis TaxID=2572576 RepID=UPI00146B0922|nr:hypothetical protein [Sphingomonas baiyangensis]